MPDIHELLERAKNECDGLSDELRKLRDARVSAELAADEAAKTRLQVTEDAAKSLAVMDKQVDGYLSEATRRVHQELEAVSSALTQATNAIKPFSEIRFRRVMAIIWGTAILNAIMFIALVVLFIYKR